VGLPALVEPPATAAVRVTRDGEGVVLWQGGDGARGVLVATGDGPDALELWDWRLAPGDRQAADAHTTGTRELLHVHAGTVELEVGEERVLLRAGDAVSFPGDVPHAYRNAGRGAARFSLAVHEPGPEGTA
jgi:quercetin dioxygenase-like cupin family protein